MSYIAGDPGSRPRLGRGPWWVVGALLVLLVVLAAALHSVVRADDAPTPPAAAPPADNALTWVRVGDQPVPMSTSHGPRIRHGGLAAGFAHDELGAVIAAINISTRLTGSAGPDVYEPTVRHQCVGDIPAALATIAVQTSTATPGTATAERVLLPHHRRRPARRHRHHRAGRPLTPGRRPGRLRRTRTHRGLDPPGLADAAPGDAAPPDGVGRRLHLTRDDPWLTADSST